MKQEQTKNVAGVQLRQTTHRSQAGGKKIQRSPRTTTVGTRGKRADGDAKQVKSQRNNSNTSYSKHGGAIRQTTEGRSKATTGKKLGYKASKSTTRTGQANRSYGVMAHVSASKSSTQRRSNSTIANLSRSSCDGSSGAKLNFRGNSRQSIAGHVGRRDDTSTSIKSGRSRMAVRRVGESNRRAGVTGTTAGRGKREYADKYNGQQRLTTSAVAQGRFAEHQGHSAAAGHSTHYGQAKTLQRAKVSSKRQTLAVATEVHLAKRELVNEFQDLKRDTGVISDTNPALSGKEQAQMARTAAKQHSAFMNEYYAVTNLTHNAHAEQNPTSSLANNLPKRDYRLKSQTTSYTATKDAVTTSIRTTRPSRRFTLDGRVITAPEADDSLNAGHKPAGAKEIASEMRLGLTAKVGAPVYRAESLKADLTTQQQERIKHSGRKMWIAGVDSQSSVVRGKQNAAQSQASTNILQAAVAEAKDNASANVEGEKSTATVQATIGKRAKHTAKTVVTKKTMARMAAVQLLYQILLAETMTPGWIQHLTETELQSLLDHFIDNGLAEACFQMQNLRKAFQKQLCIELLQAALQEYATIANELASLLINNSFCDLNLITQSIIVLGVAELHHFSETPVKVVINEYLDIANCFLEKGQTSLINGVLDKIAKTIV